LNGILENEINGKIKFRHRDIETNKGTGRQEEIYRKRNESDLRICSYNLITVRCIKRR
jgi:hypothetical protein